MKANKVKWVIAGGVLCVLLLLLSDRKSVV